MLKGMMVFGAEAAALVNARISFLPGPIPNSLFDDSYYPYFSGREIEAWGG